MLLDPPVITISTKLLQIGKDKLSTPLAHLINLSFTQGMFPTILKTENIVPIHKKDDAKEWNNYRPISLLSNV